MAVLRPLQLVIENYPEGQVGGARGASTTPRTRPWARARCRSRASSTSSRTTSARTPPKKYFRLVAGHRGAPALRATSSAARTWSRTRRARSSSCAAPTIPPRAAATRRDGRKVKGTIHWVSAAHALDAEVRLYDRLFTERPSRTPTDDWMADLNPTRWRSARRASVEPSLATAAPGARVSVRAAWATSASIPTPRPARLVFNRTVALRDTWAKIESKTEGA